ncbi:N-acetylaspartate synthetase isoform X1 [Mobula hypostoma]|uniref:N-acetylaspartate synthetase isoform X1 n=1 Tax=Mobula hypostoma TaxID=723540 RepID=UPI002FC3C665
MPISPPVMVCQTKIVADEEMPGSKNDPIVSSSQMWPPPAPQPPAGSSSPAAPLEATPGEPRLKRGAVYIREFELSDRDNVRRIFFDGIMERIPNTAFRGLKQQPRILLFYLCLTEKKDTLCDDHFNLLKVLGQKSFENEKQKRRSRAALRMYRLFLSLISIVMCFYLTKSLLLTCCVPILLLGSRYHYSRKVIVSYLECALQTDMSDIEQYYMKPAGSCFWVAVLDGNVVGIVAARSHEDDNTVELCRMSVDFDQRGKGIAKALGRKVLEFAVLNNYSAVVLGTTAVKVAAHKLYESLGFRHVGVTDHYVLPGMTHSMLERIFFQVRYHRYRLNLREE